MPRKPETTRKPPVRRTAMQILKDLKKEFIRAANLAEQEGDEDLAEISLELRSTLASRLKAHESGLPESTDSTADVEAATH